MMLTQTAVTCHVPPKLQVWLLACLVVGMTPLASLASEAYPPQIDEAPIALETEPSALTEESFTEDCLPASEMDEVERAEEDVPVEEDLEVAESCPSAAVEGWAEDEFADVDDTALAAEEAQNSSGLSINININIGSDDFGEFPDPGFEEPVEEGLPVVPGVIPVGPKGLVQPQVVKSPSKAPKGLSPKTGFQKSKSSPKKRYRFKPGSRRVTSKRVKSSARRLKLLPQQIKSYRRQVKSSGKRLKPHQRRIKAVGKRIRPNLRRSPAKKRQFRQINSVRPMMQHR